MNPIPIEDMPKNIHKLLLPEDYGYALFHPQGFQKGIYNIIHLNRKYPQWSNIILNANDEKNAADLDIVVYTRKGWEVKSIDYIFSQLISEYVFCLDYLEKNKKRLLTSTIEKMGKGQFFSPPKNINEAEERAQQTAVDTLGLMIRKKIEQAKQ